MEATGDKVIVKLSEPIAFGSETITQLELRKPKAKDFRNLPADGITMGHILDLVGRLSGQPKAVIDELGVTDLAEVSDKVAGFMPASLGTGGKP